MADRFTLLYAYNQGGWGVFEGSDCPDPVAFPKYAYKIYDTNRKDWNNIFKALCEVQQKLVSLKILPKPELEESIFPTTEELSGWNKAKSRVLKRIDEILDLKVNGPNKKIIGVDLLGKTESNYSEYANENGIIDFTFPIFVFGENDNIDSRRKQANLLKKHINKLLVEISEKFGFNDIGYINSITTLFYELMKNAMDHTEKEAYFGLNIKKVNHEIIIDFIFADRGDGIKELAGEENNYKRFTDTNFSTKSGNGLNQGIGMTLLQEECLSGLNASISLFDNGKEYKFNEINSENGKIEKNLFKVSDKIKFYYLGRFIYANN